MGGFIKSRLWRFVAWMMVTLLLVVNVQPVQSRTIAVPSQQPLSNVHSPVEAQGWRPASPQIAAAASMGDVDQQVEAARQAYEAGDYISAAAALEAAIGLLEEAPESKGQRAIIQGNLSLVYQQLNDWEGAIAASQASLDLLGIDVRADNWETQLAAVDIHPDIVAHTLDIYGRLIFSQGNPEDALVSWIYAGELHDRLTARETNPESAKRHRKQSVLNGLNQVQALQTMGRNRQSCVILRHTLALDTVALPAATTTPDTSSPLLDCQNQGGDSFDRAKPNIEELRQHVTTQIIDAYTLNEAEQTSVWQKLGEVLRVLGRLEDSRSILEDGLEIALNLPEQETPVALLKEGNFLNPNAKPEVGGQQPLSQLVPLYLSLGNTLTALGQLERDRKNSNYVDPKSITSNFGCFFTAEQTKREETAGETVSEYYQRAEFCYRDAIQKARLDDRFTLLSLQAQLNQLNLSIAYLQWLIEDVPTLIEIDSENHASNEETSSDQGQLDIAEAIARQDKAVRSKIGQASALSEQIERIPLNPARVYARLNLAQNLLKYLTLQASNPEAPVELSRLLPDPIQIVKCLEKHPEVDLGACQVDQPLPANPSNSSEESAISANSEASPESEAITETEDPGASATTPEERTDSETLTAAESSEELSELAALTELSERRLWSTIAYLLQTAVSESADLASRIEQVTPGGHQPEGSDLDEPHTSSVAPSLQPQSENGQLPFDAPVVHPEPAISPWEVRVLGGKRLESAARGSFGHLHEVLAALYRESLQRESLGQISEVASESQAIAINRAIFLLTKIARENTLTALKLAQPDKAPDVAYQWQWQLGRLLTQQGPDAYQDAIEAYKIAVDTLKKARKNLSTIDSEVQFSFRDNVEPVYRELIDLLLQPAPGAEEPSQPNLEAAIAEVGELQLAELENFLRCNVPSLTPVEKIADPNAGIIHVVLHGNNLTTILKLPNQKLIPRTTPVSQREASRTVDTLLKAIERNDSELADEASNQLYDWLIQPIRSILDDNLQDGTLVFVLDSFLRKTPIAFLSKNRGRFLIEDYAIAFAPRQEIFNTVASQRELTVFAGGVGLKQEDIEGRPLFEEIKFLKAELEAIAAIPGIKVSNFVLNDQFNLKTLEEEFKTGNYSVIHLKSHAQFSSNPSETFIVAFESLIRPNSLRNLLQLASQNRGEPIDLLVLSACSAAKGDDRAVLGLAGIATLTGARSTLSALWDADDEFNTRFMQVFYQELAEPEATKAKALQAAQKQLRGEIPKRWANYVLVGDWR